MTNAEARFSNSLRPRKPEGSLGRTAQDGHLDSHTAPELCPTGQRILVQLFKLAGRQENPTQVNTTRPHEYIHTDRQAGKLTGKLAGRQAGRQTDWQTETDRQI